MSTFLRGLIVTGLLVAVTRAGIGAEPPGVRFGITSFLGNIVHSEVGPAGVRTTPEDRTRYLDAVRDLGATTIRETFMNWAEIEPEQGKGYRFEVFDDIAQKASERGIEIVALAYPFPCWATGTTPAPAGETKGMLELPRREFEADFRRFVRTVVTRYCGQHPASLRLILPIRTWILSNELDIAGPKANTSPDDYAFWLKAFHEEVKEVDPGAKVVTLGLAKPIHDDYFPKVLASKNLQGPGYPYFDIVAYHKYLLAPKTDAAASLPEMNDIQAVVRRRLDEHKINADLWITETGSCNFDFQAQCDINMMGVVHAASTGVRRVYLHGLWDMTGYGGGILEDTPSGQVPVRKPLFVAYQTLLRMIGQNEGVQFLGPGRYRALLPGNKSVYIVWSMVPTKDKLDFLKERIRVTNLQGKQQEINANELTFSSHPVFIESHE